MFTVEMNWFHAAKVSKGAHKPFFYAFMRLCITENQSLWAFQNHRFIPPVNLPGKAPIFSLSVNVESF